MSPDDLGIEPLGAGDVPTLDELEALDEALPPDTAADARLRNDLRALEALDLRDPEQARQYANGARRALRQRHAARYRGRRR